MEIQRVQRATLWVAPFRDTRGFYPSLINIPRVNERHAVSTIFVRLRKPTVYSLVTISGRRRKKKLYLLSCRERRGEGLLARLSRIWKGWNGNNEMGVIVSCGMEFDEWYLLFFYFLIDKFFSLERKGRICFCCETSQNGYWNFFLMHYF